MAKKSTKVVKAEMANNATENTTVVENTQESQAPVATNKKPTDEELKVLREELEAMALNHKARVFPFGEMAWVNGYVKSVTIEPRAKKVFYVIRTDDGRDVRKVYGSKGLEILDEMADAPIKVRRTSNNEPRELWDAQKWDEKIREFVPAIGMWLEDGKIVSLVPDRRVNMLLLRIETTDVDGNKKISHKSSAQLDWSALVPDEKSEELSNAWLERYEKRLATEPKEKVSKRAKLEEQITKLEERLAKLKEELAALPQEAPQAEEAPVDNNEDLM